jgi:hypothetical protein
MKRSGVPLSALLAVLVAILPAAPTAATPSADTETAWLDMSAGAAAAGAVQSGDTFWAGVDGGVVAFDTTTRVSSRYDGRHGLPDVTYGSAAAAHDGTVWFSAGDAGLLRISPSRLFSILTHANTPGMPAGTVGGLSMASSGALWLEVGGRLARRGQDGGWTDYPDARAAVEANFVETLTMYNSFWTSAHTEVWVGSSSYDGSAWRDHPDGGRIVSDKDGVVWAADAEGCWGVGQYTAWDGAGWGCRRFPAVCNGNKFCALRGLYGTPGGRLVNAYYGVYKDCSSCAERSVFGYGSGVEFGEPHAIIGRQGDALYFSHGKGGVGPGYSLATDRFVGEPALVARAGDGLLACDASGACPWGGPGKMPGTDIPGPVQAADRLPHGPYWAAGATNYRGGSWWSWGLATYAGGTWAGLEGGPDYYGDPGWPLGDVYAPDGEHVWLATRLHRPELRIRWTAGTTGDPSDDLVTAMDLPPGVGYLVCPLLPWPEKPSFWVSLAAGPGGQPWAGDGCGLHRRVGEGWERVSTLAVCDLAAAADGTVFAQLRRGETDCRSRDLEIAVYPPAGPVEVLGIDALMAEHFNRARTAVQRHHLWTVAPDGAVWYVSFAGAGPVLVRRDQAGAKAFTLPNPDAGELEVDDAGDAWLGAGGKLWRMGGAARLAPEQAANWTVVPGTTEERMLTISPAMGDHPVALEVTGLPPGLSAMITPNPVAPGETFIMQIKAAGGLSPSTYRGTLRARCVLAEDELPLTITVASRLVHLAFPLGNR